MPADAVYKKKFLVDMALKDNELIHIDNATRGKECKCVCIECGGELIARKPPLRLNATKRTRAWHFAHVSNIDCKGVGETFFHRVGKEVISKNNSIVLPTYNIEKGYYWDEERFSYTNVIIEDRLFDNYIGEIRPDASVMIKGQKVLIEIVVTHPVEPITLEKMKKFGYSVLTIDLNPLLKKKGNVLTYKDIEKQIINKDDYSLKKRLYNRHDEDFKKKHEEFKQLEFLKKAEEHERKRKLEAEQRAKDEELGIICKLYVQNVNDYGTPDVRAGRIKLDGNLELIKMEYNYKKASRNNVDYFINMNLLPFHATDKRGNQKFRWENAGILRVVNQDIMKGYINRAGEQKEIVVEKYECPNTFYKYCIKFL